MSGARQTDDYKEILTHGAGLILDLAARPTADWLQVATRARAAKVTVTFRNARSRPTEDLKQIALHGGTFVIFDFTS